MRNVRISVCAAVLLAAGAWLAPAARARSNAATFFVTLPSDPWSIMWASCILSVLYISSQSGGGSWSRSR